MRRSRFHLRFHSHPSLVYLVLTAVLPFALASQFTTKATISVTIDPPHATLHIGQSQKFSAVVHGADGVKIRWAVEEQAGGTITQDGTYTAPTVIGAYRVIAIATKNGIALAQDIAKVTVVTEYDTSPDGEDSPNH